MGVAMGKWLERAAASDNSANSANSPATDDQTAPSGTNGTNGTPPAPIAEGLAALASGVTPPVRCSDLWPQVVADALRLGSDGWASAALNLGWSPLDLFGVEADPDGSADTDGLAARLCGRRVLAICESFATVADPGDGRSYLYRGDTSGGRLLWEMGRGR